MPTPLPPAPTDAKKSNGPKVMLFAAICVFTFAFLYDVFSKDEARKIAAVAASASADAGVPTGQPSSPRRSRSFDKWIFVSELLELNSTNEVAADKAAEGERYLLGVVSSVRKDVLGSPAVMLGGLPFVRATFNKATKADESIIATFDPGDVIGVRCSAQGKLLLSLGFNNCEIVWVAKADDSLAIAANYQLCLVRLLDGDGSVSNRYVAKPSARPDGGWVPAAVLAQFRTQKARLEKLMIEKKVPRIDCETPSLWAAFHCDGVASLDECKSAQMMAITKAAKTLDP